MSRGVRCVGAAALVILLCMAGCMYSENMRNSGKTEKMEAEETETELQEETDVTFHTEKISERLEGQFITLAFNGEVMVPDGELRICNGDLYTFSGAKQLKELAALCIADYDIKSKNMEFETSPLWGEIYRYALGTEYQEKVQFVTKNTCMYYRTPSGDFPVSKQIAMEEAEAFIARIYPEIELENWVAELTCDNEMNSYCVNYRSQIAGMQETNDILRFNGTGSYYQGQWISVTIDSEGVNGCQNSACFHSHETVMLSMKEELLAPLEALEVLLSYLDMAGGALAYELNEMALYYVMLPIRGEDETQRMRLSPVWILRGKAVYPEYMVGDLRGDSSGEMYIAVDMTNGEIYEVSGVLR